MAQKETIGEQIGRALAGLGSIPLGWEEGKNLVQSERAKREKEALEAQKLQEEVIAAKTANAPVWKVAQAPNPQELMNIARQRYEEQQRNAPSFTENDRQNLERLQGVPKTSARDEGGNIITDTAGNVAPAVNEQELVDKINALKERQFQASGGGTMSPEETNKILFKQFADRAGKLKGIGAGEDTADLPMGQFQKLVKTFKDYVYVDPNNPTVMSETEKEGFVPFERKEWQRMFREYNKPQKTITVDEAMSKITGIPIGEISKDQYAATMKALQVDRQNNPNRVLRPAEAYILGVPYGTKAAEAEGAIPLSPADKESNRKLSKALGIVDAIEVASQKVNTFESGAIGEERLVEGTKNWFANLLQTDPDVVMLDSKEATLSLITRAFGEVGTLTDLDIERARKAIPNIYDTKTVATRKISDLRDLYSEIARRGFTNATRKVGSVGGVSNSGDNSKDTDPMGLFK